MKMQAGDTTMFTRTAIALAIIASIASGVQATTRQTSSIPSLDVYDCRGDDVGSAPRILINRPKGGLCQGEEE